MRAAIVIAKGDGWGLGFEFYPSDCAITFHFLCWYMLIEKEFNG